MFFMMPVFNVDLDYLKQRNLNLLMYLKKYNCENIALKEE